MAKANSFDNETYEYIRKRCEFVKGQYGQRNKTMDRMEEMFLLKWLKNKPINPNILPITSPDARNALKGSARLLKATDPIVRVPHEKNDQAAKDSASKIERAGSALFYANSRMRDEPLVNEGAMSALLFGEIYATITLTSDLEKQADKGSSESYRNRIKEIARRTPAIIDIHDPRTCYPIIDDIGLAGFYRENKMTALEIIDIWGDTAREILSIKDKKINYEEPYIYCDYMDWVNRIIWIEERKDQPLLFEPHELGELPVVYRTASGSRLHPNAEDRVQPFLFDLDKTGLYEAQNMVYTMLFDHIFTLGATAQYKYKTTNPGKPLTINWENKGGYFELGPNEDVTEMAPPHLDPAVMGGMEVAERKVTESTIYRQALGEPLGSNAPYSMVALLNHAGRLPLLDAQRALTWAFGDVIEKTFRLLKKQVGGKQKIAGRTGYVELKASEIPDDFIVEVNVEVDMPQDIKQNAAIAATLINNKLTTKEWVRSKLLQIEQSDEMDKQIMIEDLVAMFTQLQIQQTLQAMQQGQVPPGQGMPPGGPPQGMPPQGMPPGGPPAPPEMQLPQGMQGMDPEQIMALMGQGNVPPEVQQAVMKQMMAQREGVSMGNPMTQPIEPPGMPSGPPSAPRKMPGGI